LSLLLDTNVVSQFASQRTDARVSQWLRSMKVTDAFLSAVTIAEIRNGIVTAKEEANRDRLSAWYTAMVIPAFGDRVLPVTIEVAELCGAIAGRAQNAGRPAGPFDAIIAATAEVHGLTVVTRNVRDFEVWGGPVFNPWDEDPPA
jgi:toxin FitB